MAVVFLPKRIRKVDIAKGNMFCKMTYIEPQAEEIFEQCIRKQ